MSPGALRPSPLVEQATEHLRRRIATGEWPVGTRLPGETTLAKDLGVGRSTVREALRALAGAGMVQARQGSGVYVLAAEPVGDWPARLRAATIAEVYEVRMLVEVQAVRLAAERRSPADLRAVQAALDGRRAAARLGDAEFVDADIALHAALVAAAHNRVLTDLFGEFLPVLRRGLVDLVQVLGLRAADPNPGDARHADLVRAVLDGDADRAAATLRAELEETLAHLRTAGPA